MAISPSTGKQLREQHIDAMFKTETDSRNRYVILVSCCYQAIPLNYCSASCPTCNSGKTIMMAVVKRGWAGYMFRVCRQCAWTWQMFASEDDKNLRSLPDEQGAFEPQDF